MELLMNYLLPFGNVSFTALALLGLTILLAGIYQLCLGIISVTLALDDTNAPDFKMENKVWKGIKFVTGEFRFGEGDYYGKVYIDNSKLHYLFLMPILVDVLVLCLRYDFFYTTLSLCIVLLIYGTRILAKKVYKNTKYIKGHEERIGKLEGED